MEKNKTIWESQADPLISDLNEKGQETPQNSDPAPVAKEGEPEKKDADEKKDQVPPETQKKDEVPPAAVDWKPPTKEEYESKMKEIENLQKVLGRQGQQLGDARKFSREVLSQVHYTPEEQEEIDSISVEKGYTAAQAKLEELKEKKAGVIQAQMVEAEKQREAQFLASVKDFNDIKPFMETILLEQGHDSELVRDVLNRPGSENPGFLSNVALAARERKARKELDEKYKRIEEHLKNQKGTLLETIEKASKAGPTLTSKSGQAGSVPQSNVDPHLLSMDELQRAVDEDMKKTLGG